ncbi:unnamed protein product [Orchesella dallaii]|uniref:Uncharacterized protein n=1 Tax=Orchesella dallaii TaxID=48710 RepID=A0ABP1Q4Q1_9HEXA
MVLTSRKTILLLCIQLIVLAFSVDANPRANHLEFKDDDDDNDDDFENWKDEVEISDGAIAAIVIGVLVIIFGIPIILCFCCAWCCFRGRKNKSPKTQIVAVTAPSAPQPQFQQQQPTFYPVSSNTTGANIPNNSATNSLPPFAPTSNAANMAYPAQQYGVNYNSNSDFSSHIYEQPPPYYDMAASQHDGHGVPSAQESEWAKPKS